MYKYPKQGLQFLENNSRNYSNDSVGEAMTLPLIRFPILTNQVADLIKKVIIIKLDGA